MRGKNSVKFYIKILTPVHVGAAQEKHLSNGLDYVTEKGKIYFLDENKILKNFKSEVYANSLSKGNLKDLLKDKDLKEYSSKIENVSGGAGSDIKTHIKNVIDNKPYIPGSSLKGAIRSVIFNDAKKVADRFEEWTFGKIHEDAFRYIIVRDSFFYESRFYNTKIFNLFKENGQWKAGWKHAFKGTNTSGFKASGFTTTYECIEVGNLAECKIELNKKQYFSGKNYSEIKEVNTLNDLFDSVEKDKLFSLLQKYMNSYLDKEIAFFNKYKNSESDSILKMYDHLKKLNVEAPVLRLGQGVGFYSITGDHKYNDHLITLSSNDKKFKSRKFAFHEVDGKYVFLPMGFVQLLNEDQAIPLLEKMELEKQKEIEKQKQKDIEREEEEEKQKQAAEEARKPQFKNYSNLNPKKRYEMEAVVSESGYPNKVDVYIETGKIQKNVKLDVYRSPIEIGEVVIIMVAVNKKGIVTQASFKNFKNS